MSEVDKLLSPAMAVALITYPSVDAQNTAIANASSSFKLELDKLLNIAFSYGKAIGMADADKKDKEMYSS